MALSTSALWGSRLVTLVLSALAAGSVAFWLLQWSAPSNNSAIAEPEVSQQAVQINPVAVAKALGGNASIASSSGATVSAPNSSRFVLTGVIADRSLGGSALIGVDGKPAKPYALGAKVSDDWVLRAVQARRALLVSSSGAEMSLEMTPRLPNSSGEQPR